MFWEAEESPGGMRQASASKVASRIELLLISREASATESASAGFGPNSLNISDSLFFGGVYFRITSENLMFDEPFSRESLSYASSLMLIVLVSMPVYVHAFVFFHHQRLLVRDSLHDLLPGKYSLACDLFEPFRFLVDLAAFTLIKAGREEKGGFIWIEHCNLRFSDRRRAGDHIPRPGEEQGCFPLFSVSPGDYRRIRYPAAVSMLMTASSHSVPESPFNVGCIRSQSRPSSSLSGMNVVWYITRPARFPRASRMSSRQQQYSRQR